MSERNNFLARLLGQDKAEELSASLEDLRKKLDAEGVERKEITAANEVLVDAQRGVGDILKNAGVEVEQEVHNQILAQVMGTLMQSGLMIAGDGESDMPEDFETDEDKPEVYRELVDEVKAIKADNFDMMEGFKEFIPAFVDMVKAIQGLVPLVAEVEAIKQHTAALADVKSRLESVEKAVNARPRSASRAPETLVDDSGLRETIKEGVDGKPEIILGIPVRGERPKYE